MYRIISVLNHLPVVCICFTQFPQTSFPHLFFFFFNRSTSLFLYYRSRVSLGILDASEEIQVFLLKLCQVRFSKLLPTKKFSYLPFSVFRTSIWS